MDFVPGWAGDLFVVTAVTLGFVVPLVAVVVVAGIARRLFLDS